MPFEFLQRSQRQSVTQTADVLSLTQPAVTAQLRSIEREIGFRLLNETAEELSSQKWERCCTLMPGKYLRLKRK
ncbi:LysR family transcriptional regulator [Bacillus sp. SL00103]